MRQCPGRSAKQRSAKQVQVIAAAFVELDRYRNDCIQALQRKFKHFSKQRSCHGTQEFAEGLCGNNGCLNSNYSWYRWRACAANDLEGGRVISLGATSDKKQLTSRIVNNVGPTETGISSTKNYANAGFFG